MHTHTGLQKYTCLVTQMARNAAKHVKIQNHYSIKQVIILPSVMMISEFIQLFDHQTSH